MTQLEMTIGLLRELVGYQSISSESNLGVIAALATRLEDAGARVLVESDATGTKANLFATLGPEGDGGIVLSGHTDVVPVAEQAWTSDPFVVREDGGRLFGRGTCDMKGFIAAAVVQAPDFAALDLKRPLHFAFTYDEEIGCVGGQRLAATLRARGIRPSAAIIGEPTSMLVIEGHKGCCEYTTRFHGLAGHGSVPDNGVSAVEYAVRYVSRLLELREALKLRSPPASRFDPPWTTINAGSVTGGTAHNIIAENATVEWEMRPVQDSDARFVKAEVADYVNNVLLPAMQSVCPDASIETEIMGEVVGLEPADENEARDILMALTGANGTDVVPFGTEAGIFQSLGLSAIVCGPGSIEQAHKPDEYLEIAQLEECIRMLSGLKGYLHVG